MVIIKPRWLGSSYSEAAESEQPKGRYHFNFYDSEKCEIAI